MTVAENGGEPFDPTPILVEMCELHEKELEKYAAKDLGKSLYNWNWSEIDLSLLLDIQILLKTAIHIWLTQIANMDFYWGLFSKKNSLLTIYSTITSRITIGQGFTHSKVPYVRNWI